MACVLALAGIGLVMVLSASYFWARRRAGISSATHLFQRQALYVGGSLLIMLITSSIPLRWIKKSVIPLYLGSLALLVLVLLPGVGESFHGSSRWIRLGPIGYQPSELAKISVILSVAYYAWAYPECTRTLFQGYLPLCALIGGPCLLVLLEPDLGTGMFLLGLGLSVGLAGGLRLVHLIPSLLLTLPPTAFLMWARFSHFRQRLLVFLNPGSDPLGTGHQIRQSLIALGSGSTYGVGLGGGRQKLFFLPQQHSDFIFSVIGEEAGFAGALLVILLYMGLAWFGLRIAMNSRDRFGKLAAAGITICISLQAIINMAVATAVFPTKGLPLPLISYGGSSMVTTFFMVGLLLAINGQTASDRNQEAAERM